MHAGWDWARLAGLIELHGGTARPGWRLRAWDDDDTAVLRGWVALFDAWSLAHPFLPGGGSGPDLALVAEVIEAVPQLLSFMHLSNGPVALDTLLDLLRQRVAELRTERHEPPADGDPLPGLLDWALEALSRVGAVQRQHTAETDEVSLTALGNWAVWVKLEQICVAAQGPAGHMEQSAATMLRACARLSPSQARAEYRAWLAARPVGHAVAELLDTARGDDALLRGLAFEALRMVGDPAEAAVRAVVDEPGLRPYAVLWLAELGGHDPDAATELLTREEATWLWIDTAAAVADHGEDHLLVSHLETAVQGSVPGLLEEVRGVGHPRTVQVLVALAAAHPDPALAKAIRRAAFVLHSGGSTAEGRTATVTASDEPRPPTRTGTGAQPQRSSAGRTAPEGNNRERPGSGNDHPPAPPEHGGSGWDEDRGPELRHLVVELAEQAPSGRDIPLQVQIVREAAGGAVTLREFGIPEHGARLLITVHAPGLLALGDLQQEVTVVPGSDSDVLRFGLRTLSAGLHMVTVRAFHGGTFLGELRAQISVQADTPARMGPLRSVPLPTLAFDPGEVTLQVLKGLDGTYSFQLLSETTYAPETFRILASDPDVARDRIYDELRRTAASALGAGEGAYKNTRQRLRNLGVQLWSSAVPEAVRRQFWAEAGRVTALTVLGDQDVVPWELLYPLDGQNEGDGFLAEWLPVVRRVFGQDRVRELALSRAAFVVPPGSPPEADQEVLALRARLGDAITDGGTLTHRAAVSELIDRGLSGLLHFACHNAFTSAGSHVTMADGPFDPIDLAFATQSGALRPSHPLVFFNACRSAGEISWFSTSLGWASQFLRAGAGAFIGTVWPVRSDSALIFADTFYRRLVEDGQTLAQASLNARRAIRDHGGDPTWLAYAVYGSPAAIAAAR